MHVDKVELERALFSFKICSHFTLYIITPAIFGTNECIISSISNVFTHIRQHIFHPILAMESGSECIRQQNFNRCVLPFCKMISKSILIAPTLTYSSVDAHVWVYCSHYACNWPHSCCCRWMEWDSQFRFNWVQTIFNRFFIEIVSRLYTLNVHKIGLIMFGIFSFQYFFSEQTWALGGV